MPELKPAAWGLVVAKRIRKFKGLNMEPSTNTALDILAEQDRFFMAGKAQHRQIAALFGRNLRRILLAKAWNQADLVKASGLTRDHVSRYYNWKSLPSTRAMTALCRALGCQPDDLRPLAPEPIDTGELPRATLPTGVRMTVLENEPGYALVTINQRLPVAVAAKIVELASQNMNGAQDDKANGSRSRR